MAKSNRRSFLAKAPALAVATVGATAAAAEAKDKPKAPAAQPAPAVEKPVKKVLWNNGKAPEKQALFSPAVSFGNLLFISGIGAHFEGDIKAHTDHVLNEIKKKLEDNGSSMEKVLKVNVYLNDLKDYAAMNEVFLGRFGLEPGVRTTIAAAGGIPGNSLVEIDCIAYI
jgi:enamine deaminase RidA (YjgF/YER057c/UK114 family)